MTTIETAKGGTAGTLAECVAWQVEHQGAFASIVLDDGTTVDVADVDYADADAALAEVERRIVAEGKES
jgi:hypothetical protein